ncbi:oxidoreductase [Chitinibacteraceae bacterium HSL-7]
MPLRVGLIGYGYAGRTIHAPLIQACKAMRLVAVASSRPADVIADLPDVVVKCDADKLIAHPGIDVVVIATPNDTHAGLAKAALACGKHVVVDKPFTITVAEAETVADAAERSGLVLSVFQNRRWDADFVALSELIRHGSLGRITEFTSRFDRYRPDVRQRWREDNVPGGGLWFDLGPHLIDQALQLFGMPTTVSADLAIRRTAAKTIDDAHVVLHYPELRVVLGASQLVAGGTPRFVVHGTHASFEKHGLDQQEGRLKEGLSPLSEGFGADLQGAKLWTQLHDEAKAEPLALPGGDYAGFYPAFAAAVRGKGCNPVPPSEAVQVMRALEAAIKASQTGTRTKP